jgi:putative Ig domain-containing protein/fibronectin type III domain protein
MRTNRYDSNASSRPRRCALVLFLAAICSALAPAIASAATSVTIAWDQATDGVTAGYYVYYGTQSGNYSGYVDVKNSTSAVMSAADSTATYYFAVQAYSSAGDKSQMSAEISWKAATLPPTLQNPGSMSTTVGQSATLQLVATDPAGLTLKYSATGLPPGLAIASTTGFVSGSPTTAGAYNVTATATNTANLSASQLFTWTILAPATPSSQAPTLQNPGSMSTTVGQGVSLQLVATDPAGLTLKYSATGLPPGLGIASTTGFISGSPTTAGVYNVTATVSNTAGLSASQLFQWTILAPATTGGGGGGNKGGNGNGGGGNGGGNSGGGGGNGNGNGGGGSYTPPATSSPTDPTADITPPTVSIISPTIEPTFVTEDPMIILTGTATDNVGVVNIMWTNSRGGVGTTLGTSSWATTPIDLKMGDNVITITAADAAGNIQSVTLTITRYQDLQNHVN